MANTKTTYLGLTLSSPLIVSSSGLTASIENILSYEKAGAGAVVLKSLFEEQILSEAAYLDTYSDIPEAADYLNSYVKDNSLAKYTNLISSAKSACSIPIIASINCTKGGQWIKYAKDIESAGADALELNVYFMPVSKEQSAQQIENGYMKTISQVVDSISIPVSVKLSNHFTNPLNVINELYYRGVKGVVLFNRFYEPDINIEDLTITSTEVLSSRDEMRNITRWIAKASIEINQMDYASSTGVNDGESVVKMMLAGAKAVQVCSVIYRNGAKSLEQMNEFLSEWMARHSYNSTEQFIGKINKSDSNSILYDRVQFMKYFSSYK